jgi:dipeptidyl aminopeptidase/acylaminoacyl peptidase
MKTIAFLLLLPVYLAAQQPGFDAFKSYPFTANLRAATNMDRLAWMLDEQGKRNIFVAEGPAYRPRQLTFFDTDSGQEISSLSFSPDGQWLVFVRGGDHGANWDSGLPVNPLEGKEPFKVQVAAVPFAGGPVTYLSEGDDPVVNTRNQVAFVKSGQAWMVAMDSAGAAKQMFSSRGMVSQLQWAPDGNSIAFTVHRTGHSLVGFYDSAAARIAFIDPSFNQDNTPQWSPDSKQIAFIRQPAEGGAPDSLLVAHPSPWQIFTTRVDGSGAELLWSSGNDLRSSLPGTDGRSNLHWAAGDRIVFLSYQDGWPHLYSIAAGGGKPLLLTPGQFMCEHISMAPGNRQLVFSVNTGDDIQDIDRRHIAMVSTGAADMKVLTTGTGLEWTPAVTGGGTLAYISATAKQPPLPAIMALPGGKPALLAADHIPATFPEDKMVIPHQVVFTAADGTELHGQLFEPKEKKTPRPAIIYVHGGPPRQMLLGWNYSDYYANAYASNQYLASLGFTVLAVNYRLGIGYGFAFHRPPHAGITGAAEYQDIRTAGKWLQQQPGIDPHRIGIYGGSYGGYLTALALARDSRLFADGVDIHGVHNWLKPDGPYSGMANRYEKPGDYEKAMAVAWQSSPVASTGSWTSPVLIIHGDDDRNVSFTESIDLIGRLKKHGVKYETLMIPDDTHHWMRFQNAVTVYGAVAAYFLRQLHPGK